VEKFVGGGIELQQVIGEMRREMAVLQAAVGALTTKVDFIMSYLGIEQQQPAACPEQSDRECDHADDQAVSQGSSAGGHQPPAAKSKRSYAQVVALPTPSGQGIREDIRSAIHQDLLESAKRRKHVIIKGLRSADGVPEKTMVADFCRNELKMEVHVRACYRLGRPDPELEIGDEPRVRPIRVVLADENESALLLNSAKLLRRSKDDYIRTKIYIDRDLTRAESQAAYLQRCRRREHEKDSGHGGRRAAASSTQGDAAQKPSSGETPAVEAM
jgi:hypothetical protein